MLAQCDYANGYDQTAEADQIFDRDGVRCRDGAVYTARVGSYGENGFGLSDILGIVWERVEDCWNENYVGAPGDGSAWIAAGNCRGNVGRGGDWSSLPYFLRSADRNWFTNWDRYYYLGFRVARMLNP